MPPLQDNQMHATSKAAATGDAIPEFETHGITKDTAEFKYDQEGGQQSKISSNRSSVSSCSPTYPQRDPDSHASAPLAYDKHPCLGNDMEQHNVAAAQHSQEENLHFGFKVLDPGPLRHLHQLPSDVSPYLQSDEAKSYCTKITQMAHRQRAEFEELNKWLAAKLTSLKTRMSHEMHALRLRHEQQATEQSWHMLPEDLQHQLHKHAQAEMKDLICRHSALECNFIKLQDRVWKQKTAAMSKTYDDWRWWLNLETMRHAGLLSLPAHNPAQPFHTARTVPQHNIITGSGRYPDKSTGAAGASTAAYTQHTRRASSGLSDVSTMPTDVSILQLLDAARKAHTRALSPGAENLASKNASRGQMDAAVFASLLASTRANPSLGPMPTCIPSPFPALHNSAASCQQGNMLQQLAAVMEQQQLAAGLPAVAPAGHVGSNMQQLMMDLAVLMQAAPAPPSVSSDTLLGAPMIPPPVSSSSHSAYAATPAPEQAQQVSRRRTDESDGVADVHRLMMQLMM